MWVCRLPVHIDPAECTVLYEKLRRIRDFPMGRQSRRPLQRPSLSPVGADDPVRRICRFYGNLRRIRLFPVGRCGHRPLQPNAQVHTNPPRIFDDPVPSAGRSRAPPLPRLWANSYCHTNFERRAFLPQLFKRSYPQIRYTVTGGAYLSARRVSLCVRNDL